MNRGILLIFAGLAAACSKGETPARDAGPDLATVDTLPPPSDAPISLAVDFAVENCPSFDPVALTCTGDVPLTVRFVPLATTTVTKYLWDFGDFSSTSEATPSHTYTTPNPYTVKIIATGVGGGVVTKIHTGFIVAKTKGPGQLCDMSVQCDPGLFCLCSASGACSTGPAHGICATTCSSGLCGNGQICAGLATAASPPAGPEPWQTDLCLAGCQTDTDCATGLRCRTLPPGRNGSAWVHGCFADVPRDIGEACMDDSGTLRDDLCATGTCVDMGAMGMCSMECGVNACPLGSDCAEFGDGRKLCLRGCVGSVECVSDALLPCTTPTAGDLGYRLVDSNNAANAPSTHCAPKPCTEDDALACQPAGVCAAPNGNGHCVRR